MPLWTLPTANKARGVSRTSSSVSYTSVVTSSSANTKGSWAQVTASCPINTSTLFIRGNGFNSTGVASPALMDIAIGASGQEQIVLANLDVGFSATNAYWVIPVNIPAGQRIAYRIQSPRTSVTFQTVTDYIGEIDTIGGAAGVVKWSTYGADTTNSRGTAITPGNSGTMGSWVQIGTADNDHCYWIARADMGANAATTAINYRCQLAWGPNTTAASLCVTNGTHLELPNTFALTTAEILNQYQYDYDPTYMPVPADTPIWVRATGSGTAQTIYVIVHGGL